MAWNPPDYADFEGVEEIAREMGFLLDKSGQENLQYLREETDVNVIGVPERVSEYYLLDDVAIDVIDGGGRVARFEPVDRDRRFWSWSERKRGAE